MNLEVGAILEGKVTGIAKFGAFVSLPCGKSGLVHISEVANTYISSVEEHLSVGQDVKVKIISIDDKGRINLSIKQAAEGGDAGSAQSRPGASPRQARQSPGRSQPQQGQERRHRSETPPIYEGELQPKSDNQAFEDSLKKFLQESDSKISESGRYDRQRSTRRRSGGRR